MERTNFYTPTQKKASVFLLSHPFSFVGYCYVVTLMLRTERRKKRKEEEEKRTKKEIVRKRENSSKLFTSVNGPL